MANYEKIMQLRPEMVDFFRNRRNIGVRGDVLTYGLNIETESFTTDGAGFRHSTFGGKSLSLAQCVRSSRYGIVLGASNVFGFGVAGNENCLSSLLAERFGFPFANAAMPGANSRTLHSLLIGLIAGAPERPAVVVHSTGGDLGNFCESGFADSIFGSPNRSQLKWLKERNARGDPDRNFPGMLAFSALWASALATVCRVYRIPFVLIHQSTFFEKASPSAIELECGLGEAFHPAQEYQFSNHRKFDQPYYARRKAFADARDIPLAGWGLTDQISFIDEFHCDRDGTRLIGRAVGDAIEQLFDSKSIIGNQVELTPHWPLN
jgi:hypothetical protein